MFSAFWRASCWAASIALCIFIFAKQDCVLADPPPAMPAPQKPAKPGAITKKVLVKISKETTFITAPLQPCGYPDYFAALNQRMSKGVTPENNSSVLFLKAAGPSVIPKDIREEYFRLLGIPPLPEEGDYFVNSEEFVQQERDAERLSYDDGDNDFEKWSSLNRRRPWSKKEFPLMAKWLELNEKPLAIAIEASKRPRRFDPYLCVDKSLLLGARFQYPIRSVMSQKLYPFGLFCESTKKSMMMPGKTYWPAIDWRVL